MKLKIRNYTPKSRTIKTADYDPVDAWVHVTYEECEHEGLRANHFSYKIGSKTDCFECDQEDRGLVPVEVLEALEQYLDETITPERIQFAAKAATSRSEAWSCFGAPVLDSGQWWNPWRKCHTENYWVWYSVEKSES